MIIVYAHPNRSGHCGVVLKTIEKYFEEKGTKYEIWDLYRMNFDPILKSEELNNKDTRSKDIFIRGLQDKIELEKEFIFVYPTWWYNMPAILKGFFDRVFAARFAFKYKNKIPIPLLKNKKALVITTAGGPKFFYSFIKIAGPLRIVEKNILNFCGIKTRSYLFGNCVNLSEKKEKEIQKKVLSLLAK